MLEHAYSIHPAFALQHPRKNHRRQRKRQCGKDAPCRDRRHWPPCLCASGWLAFART